MALSIIFALVNGEIYSSGTAERKVVAREEASRQALDVLGVTY
jgi:hypothetical protein